MQYVSAPFIDGESSNQSVSTAVLRDDGSVYVKIDGKLNRASDAPAKVKQIALCLTGVWAIDRRGVLFRWNGDLTDSQWDRVEAQKLKEIFGLDDGRLCVVTRAGKPLIYNDHENDKATVDTASTPTNRWLPDPEVTDWMNPRPAKRTSYLSFGLRSMLFSVLVLSLALGPWTLIQRGRERDEAVKLLTLQGADIHYAYEYDAAGTFIPDAVEPGASWLKSLFGRQMFVTPVKLSANKASLDLSLIARLTQLKRINLGTWRELVDISPLRPLRQVEEFRVVRSRISDISALSGMRNLQKLDLTGARVSDISPIAELQKIKNLDLSETSVKDISPLRDLTALEILDLDGCKIQSIQPITNLTNLRELTYESWQRRSLHPYQLNKLTKLKTLRIGNLDTVKSADWSREMIALTKTSPSNWYYGLKKDRPQESYLSLTEDPTDSMPIGPEALIAINLSHSLFEDLAAVKDLIPKAKHISIANTVIKDLSPLADHASKFETITLDGSRVADLSVFKNSKVLTRVNVANTPVSDLSPLALSEKLRVFDASNSRVTDISPLSELERVAFVNLSGTDVSDISALSNLKASLYLKDTKVEDLKPLANFEGGRLNLEGSLVRSLEPLRTAKFTSSQPELNISNTQVSDLSPLAAQKTLFSLSAENTPVQDISSLSKMKSLQRLSLSGTRVADLSPLRNLRYLTELRLNGTDIDDLSHLAGLFRLKTIDVSNTSIDKIPNMKKLAGLRDIDFSDTNIKDLSPFSTMKFRILPQTNGPSVNLARTKVTDLTPLQRFKLIPKLNLDGTNVTDLSTLPMVENLSLSKTKITSLVGLTFKIDGRHKPAHLESLNLSHSKIVDVSELANYVELRRINLAGTKVTDFSALANLKNLENVDVSGTSFSDPSFLHASKNFVEWLDLSNTPLADLDGLVPMTQLGTLNLSGTKVVDLKPIERFLPYGLDDLNLTGCAISDIRPLSQLPGLLHLKLDCQKVEDLAPLKSMRILESLRLENISPKLDLSPLGKLEFVTELWITGEVGDLAPLARMIRLEQLHLTSGAKVPNGFVDSVPRLKKLFVGDEEVYSYP